MTYKVYKKGNFLEVVDTNNGQIYNARLADARIKRHDTSNVWYDFYKDGEKFLSKIFLNQIVDENDVAYLQQDFEDFVYCTFGKTVIGDSCEGLFNIPQDGQDSPDANVLIYEAYIKDYNEISGGVESAKIIDLINGTWSRISAGTYRYTKTGAFAIGTTFFTLHNGISNQEVREKITVTSSNHCTLRTYDSSGVLTDDLIDDMYISIKIRPQ